MRSYIHGVLFGTAVCAMLAAPALAQDTGWNGHAEAPRYNEDVFPPWQHGANNDALNRGFEFTVPEVDDLADFHGNPTDAKLVLFVGGNYFFAMAPLVQAFDAAHPEYKGRIYWETIPPGLLVKQMEAGGTVTVGNMTWTAKPDAYLAGLAKVNELIKQGLLAGEPVPYVTNTLTIMVPKGNPSPHHGTSRSRQARCAAGNAQPGVRGHRAADQDGAHQGRRPAPSERSSTTEKVKDGSTILTQIHHRQTPLFLMQGVVDAGITWQSEAMFQEQAGHPIEHVAIPDADNATAIYAGAEVKGAAHPEAAQAWLDFIRSPAALAIFERYGFKPYTATN